MKCDKYMGLDVHQATTVAAVVDGKGKLVLETIVPTEASAIQRLVGSFGHPLHVTLEETTQAQWLYEVIHPLVSEMIVCDPKQNKRPRGKSKGDRKDALDLAERLRLGNLASVWHGHQQTRKLKQLVQAYWTFSVDTQRTMSRIKAVYRGRGIRTPGRGVYQVKQRSDWLSQLSEPGMRQRTGWLYEQLDHVRELRKQIRSAVLTEGRKHKAIGWLRTIPQIGPLRAAQIVAIMGTPHRFRTKCQLWSYSGLGVVTHGSAEYEFEASRYIRRQKPVVTRGLNENCNRRLKYIFISAATAGGVNHPYERYLTSLEGRGIRPEMARLTLARKIANVVLTLWKRGEAFDPKKLNWMMT